MFFKYILSIVIDKNMSFKIQDINSWNYDKFIEVFGNVIEHFPVLAGGLWAKRPFQSLDDLNSKILQIVATTQLPLLEGILRVHPDLAGRLAEAGTLTAESKKEQKSAGLDLLTEEEKAQLKLYNNTYKEKFDFPFIICARDNKKNAIFDGIQKRINNSKEKEIHIAIEEVKKICYYRLCDLVDENDLVAKI